MNLKVEYPLIIAVSSIKYGHKAKDASARALLTNAGFAQDSLT